MTNLGLNGVVSLRAVNQWIGAINSNINNSHRTGYKETKVYLEGGIPDQIGVQAGTLNRALIIPASTLQIAQTRILDYEQGFLNNTQVNTHLALKGKGYFVVEDDKGRRFATRDGEFKFSNDGYLVNAYGLKVLSTAQDYIRVPAGEVYWVDDHGNSESPDTRNPGVLTPVLGTVANTLYRSSIFGNKKVMVVNLPDSGQLYYSKYGYTTFELGEHVPGKIENDFSEVTDGIAPDLSNTATTNYENYFYHSKILSRMDVYTNNFGLPEGFRRHAGISARKYTNFQTRINFSPNYAGGNDLSFGFQFGQKKINDTINESGLSAGIEGNNLVIRQNTGTVGVTIVAATVPLPAINANDNLGLMLSVKGDQILLEFDNITTGTYTFASVGSLPLSAYEGTYHSLGTMDAFLPAGGGLVDTSRIAITNIISYESGKSTYNGVTILSRQASYDTDPQWVNPPGGGLGADPNLGRNIENTLVIQNSLEESTSTVIEYIPMLASAQKLFAALAKIINMFNSVSDDMNNMIR